MYGDFFIHPLWLFAQYVEGQEFATRLLEMGSLSFIIEDPETELNLYAFEENPVDLINYCQDKRALHFVNRIYDQYYYYMPQYREDYNVLSARYLQRINGNFALGFVSISRIIPHSLSITIPSRYDYRILLNSKIGKLHLGYATMVKILSSNRCYHSIQHQPDIALDLNIIKLGTGYNWRTWYDDYSLWPHSMDYDFSVPIIFYADFVNCEELFVYRYYSERGTYDTVFFPRFSGYDIENRFVFNKNWYNMNLRTGLKLHYRRLNETDRENMSTFFNIVPGISVASKSIVFGTELFIIKSAFFNNELFFQPRFGIEIKKIKQLNIRLGLAKTSAQYDFSWTEIYIDYYNLKPMFINGGFNVAMYYSLAIDYMVSDDFKFDCGVSLIHSPGKSMSLLPTISFKWSF